MTSDQTGKSPVVAPGQEGPEVSEAASGSAIHHPEKVMRIGAMIRGVLDEVRSAPLDEASRARVREIYDTSVKELGKVLSPDLQEELGRMSLPFKGDTPSESELRIAQAQLVGWLEGLFHGIQAMLFAQQMESRRGLEELQARGLPRPASSQEHDRDGHSTYL